MHAEGEDASHLLHASEVRNAWLESAMREAEVEDRTSGVWDLTSDKWEAGDVVQIEGLNARQDLNDATGILLHWVKGAGRWAESEGYVHIDTGAGQRAGRGQSCSASA